VVRDITASAVRCKFCQPCRLELRYLTVWARVLTRWLSRLDFRDSDPAWSEIFTALLRSFVNDSDGSGWDCVTREAVSRTVLLNRSLSAQRNAISLIENKCLRGGRLSDSSGNSRFPHFGDTGAAVLQKADEPIFSATENLLHIGEMSCVQCAPHLWIFKNFKVSAGKRSFFKYAVTVNPLTPNGHYIGRTAPLTSRRRILKMYPTIICTEYFKHAA
jgi:hypothetical protein